ncbi:MAG: hypothetical protein QNJ64_02260 [Crocosphaera sp.]|nr:hypothetical protein [Crocosphaera sp.]
MFGLNKRSPLIKILSSSLLVSLLCWGLVGCSDRLEVTSPGIEPSPVPVTTNKLSEVAPPPVIQELKEVLDQYHPQVSIISPQPQEIVSETTVSLQLEVRDYPLFKDETLGLGPNLHLFVDDQPYRAVYDVDEPIILEDLSPGTHTIRVFASRPWHESFKNEGAYAQTTFSVFTETEDNAPKPTLPLLTYSRPQGSYGAEPIMLDFYLTNAPLHFVANNDPDDDIIDWRIKATINGESFLIDTWQPIYLKGFEPGKNWVQLEFIDEQGHEVNNAFNNTVRVITYEPNGEDSLSKLVRGELSTEIARSIVDPNYIYTSEPTPTQTVEEEPQETASDSVTSETVEEEPTTPEEPQETASESVTPETVEEEPTTPEEPQETASESITPETVEEEPTTAEETVQEELDIPSEQASKTVIDNPTTELSDLVEAEPVVSSSEDINVSKRPQWLDNLLQSLPKIDLKSLTHLMDK